MMKGNSTHLDNSLKSTESQCERAFNKAQCAFLFEGSDTPKGDVDHQIKRAFQCLGWSESLYQEPESKRIYLQCLNKIKNARLINSAFRKSLRRDLDAETQKVFSVPYDQFPRLKQWTTALLDAKIAWINAIDSSDSNNTSTSYSCCIWACFSKKSTQEPLLRKPLNLPPRC